MSRPRLLLVVGTCTVLGWLLSLIMLGVLLEQPSPPADSVIAALLALEIVASPVAAGLLWSFWQTRSRRTGLPLVLLGVFTGVALPAGLLAFVQLAARRELATIVWMVCMTLVAFVVQDQVMVRLGAVDDAVALWELIVATVAVEVVLVLIGLFIGNRRALLESLRDQADGARRERDLHVAQARAQERHRMATEMHDSLAHHLALISLHASALERREDLPPETVRETSRTVAGLSRTAADELRTVLGVLRSEPSTAAPPQGASAIPALIEQHRDAGVEVVADLDEQIVQEGAGLDAAPSEANSRLLFLAVQQCLSNAARHAPGARVDLELARVPEGVRLRCSNALAPYAAADPGAGLGAGLGLTAMAERTRLAGGRQQAGMIGEDFVVEVVVPW